MAKKKVKSKGKNVQHTIGKESETKDVTVTSVEVDPEPTPKPAIQAEPMMKTVGKGGFVERLTKSEYDKKYGKKKSKK